MREDLRMVVECHSGRLNDDAGAGIVEATVNVCIRLRSKVLPKV